MQGPLSEQGKWTVGVTEKMDVALRACFKDEVEDCSSGEVSENGSLKIPEEIDCCLILPLYPRDFVTQRNVLHQ
jgi:hypothetical protein